MRMCRRSIRSLNMLSRNMQGSQILLPVTFTTGMSANCRYKEQGRGVPKCHLAAEGEATTCGSLKTESSLKSSLAASLQVGQGCAGSQKTQDIVRAGAQLHGLASLLPRELHIAPHTAQYCGAHYERQFKRSTRTTAGSQNKSRLRKKALPYFL